MLRAAEAAGFDVFFTADKNLRYQQNLTGRKIGLVVLGNSPWPLVKLHIPEIVEAVRMIERFTEGMAGASYFRV